MRSGIPIDGDKVNEPTEERPVGGATDEIIGMEGIMVLANNGKNEGVTDKEDMT